jgi:hypothetical protein
LHSSEEAVPYLAQLLAGYRSGIDHHPPESGETVRAALAEEDDAFRRGVLLALLANSLVQPDRSPSKIGETTELKRAMTEVIQKPLNPSDLQFHFGIIAEPSHLV